MSTVAFDFDGVIHTYEKGWHDGTIYGEPVEGIFDLIRYTQTQHAVFVHTTRDPEQVAHWIVRQDNEFKCVTERSHLSGYHTTWWYDTGVRTNEPMVRGQEIYLGTVKFWNDYENLFVSNRKLPAVAYVDDRAVRFMNSHQALNQLRQHGVLTYG